MGYRWGFASGVCPCHEAHPTSSGAFDSPVMPEATDVATENQELFWRHRERIAAIGIRPSTRCMAFSAKAMEW